MRICVALIAQCRATRLPLLRRLLLIDLSKSKYQLHQQTQKHQQATETHPFSFCCCIRNATLNFLFQLTDNIVAPIGSLYMPFCIGVDLGRLGSEIICFLLAYFGIAPRVKVGLRVPSMESSQFIF